MSQQNKANIVGIRKRLLARLKKRKRAFGRCEGYKLSFPENWRRPRGIHNKTKAREKSKPKRPSRGYKTPFIVRGLHPSGYEEVRISTQKELSKINPRAQAARFSSTLGGRARKTLLAKAKELGIKVLNP